MTITISATKQTGGANKDRTGWQLDITSTAAVSVRAMVKLWHADYLYLQSDKGGGYDAVTLAPNVAYSFPFAVAHKRENNAVLCVLPSAPGITDAQDRVIANGVYTGSIRVVDEAGSVLKTDTITVRYNGTNLIVLEK